MVRAIRVYVLAYPFLFIGVFFLTWVAARLSLGRWARPYLDDPKQIGVWVASQRRHLFTVAVVSLLFMIAVMSFLWWDPLRILEWFAD